MNKTYVFSAPGRTEIGGNHTDHQSGCVLAAAVNLEIVAEVIPNNLNRIRIKSDRYMAFSIDLANEYETIPGEMKEICNFFGKEVLREIPETEFFEALPKLRKIVPDRAILRAIHIYQENKRVIKEMECLKKRFGAFF